MLPKHRLDRLAYVRQAIKFYEEQLNILRYDGRRVQENGKVLECLRELEARFAQELMDEIARRKIRDLKEDLAKEKGAEAPYDSTMAKRFLKLT